jgi:hypothetical protein
LLDHHETAELQLPKPIKTTNQPNAQKVQKNSATFAKATITTQNVFCKKNPKTTQERHKAYSFAVRA